MTKGDKITAEAALDAGARLIADLVGGLVTTPEGREDVVLDLIAQLSRSRDGREAETEIMRRAVERLRGEG
ncbi:hypothetical protein [Pseudogemmobacter faecipullorum]|uniref:Uncharacterized protein n=1 Tax=Pseudogemmobacter faecipullorum TaxID=2755041 RepID=A0ABS8CRK9_9RHOB|nr:hypothetical protein [Pseudogemmobacter faecipullorum]MCB5411808.1 hypothetical protein [Pseudogemmobacter faecipullorum]